MQQSYGQIKQIAQSANPFRAVTSGGDFPKLEAPPEGDRADPFGAWGEAISYIDQCPGFKATLGQGHFPSHLS